MGGASLLRGDPCACCALPAKTAPVLSARARADKTGGPMASDLWLPRGPKRSASMQGGWGEHGGGTQPPYDQTLGVLTKPACLGA